MHLSAPSINDQVFISPRKEQTNHEIDYENPSYPRKLEGRKGSSYKPAWMWTWVALWKKVKPTRKKDYLVSEICEEGINLPKFDWAMIAFATNHFSFSNKVGEGGYGPVYKAVFPSGQIVAVRRISSSRNQSLVTKEILMVQRLQHRNILKLLGYCIHKETLILVHEFMENSSLDKFIFGRFQHIGWTHRFKIIRGVARGVAYLHQDSGMRIVHGDLKPSHILLDITMNPKLSGFGLARTSEEEACESITTAVYGTLGYISPDDSRYGMVSVPTQSDVYSFGVVVLEIVSGKKCIHHGQYIVNVAREMWTKDKALDVVDEAFGCNDPLTPTEEEEVLRCIKVGLLCTQTQPHLRPTMPAVVKLLKGELSADLQEMEWLQLPQQVDKSHNGDGLDVTLKFWHK